MEGRTYVRTDVHDVMAIKPNFLTSMGYHIYHNYFLSYGARLKRAHNCKGVEGTFAKAEARREFLKSIQEQEVVDQCKGCDTHQVQCSFCNILKSTIIMKGVWKKALCDF